MLISTITAAHNQDTSKLSVNPFHALACLQAVETSENENFLKFFQDGRGGGRGGVGEEGGYKVTSDIKLDQNKNCFCFHTSDQMRLFSYNAARLSDLLMFILHFNSYFESISL